MHNTFFLILTSHWNIGVSALELPGNLGYFFKFYFVILFFYYYLFIISQTNSPASVMQPSFAEIWVYLVSLTCILVISPGKRSHLKIVEICQDYKKFTLVMFSHRDVSLAFQWTLQKRVHPLFMRLAPLCWSFHFAVVSGDWKQRANCSLEFSSLPFIITIRICFAMPLYWNLALLK